MRKPLSSERGLLIFNLSEELPVDTDTSFQNPDFPGSSKVNKPYPGKEQLTIVIEQGTVVSFRQNMLYPYLEGVYGEGI